MVVYWPKSNRNYARLHSPDTLSYDYSIDRGTLVLCTNEIKYMSNTCIINK